MRPLPRLSDEKWVELHAPRFGNHRSVMWTREVPGGVLKEFCHRVAPLAIVQARAKGVPSFAEKSSAKRNVYTDPTDRLPRTPWCA